MASWPADEVRCLRASSRSASWCCFSLRVHVLSSVALLGALLYARRPDARGQVSMRIDPGGGPSPTLHNANRIFLAARPSTADLSGSSTAHRSAPHQVSSSRATATEQASESVGGAAQLQDSPAGLRPQVILGVRKRS